jgi:histidinol dehydrogenase
VIAGPGNLYVQEAKRQVFGQVGIDGFAGPSDLLVLADGTADAKPLALDLLAQAEHGPGTLVVAISTDQPLLDALQAHVAPAPDTGAVAMLVHAPTVEQALALTQSFAPEHLQLVGEHAEALAPEIARAGCVFVGPSAATAFGDYIAGSNHVLPTNGAARFASALTPAHFRRTFTEVRIAPAAATRLAQAAAPVARAEGFELHAQSMEARIRENG